MIATSSASAFGCMPLRNGYEIIQNHPNDGCIDRFSLQFTANILHLITDAIIWLLPMPHLWRLRLKRQKRIRTIVIFSVGTVPCLASAIRLRTVIQFYKGDNPTLQAIGIAILSAVEVNLVIIAASIPASNAFYSRFFIHPVKRRLQVIWPSLQVSTADTGRRNYAKGYGNVTSAPDTRDATLRTAGKGGGISKTIEISQHLSPVTASQKAETKATYRPTEFVVMELQSMNSINDVEGDEHDHHHIARRSRSEDEHSEASIVPRGAV